MGKSGSPGPGDSKIPSGLNLIMSSAGLIIEVDGGQHFTDDGKGNDRVRDDYMKSLGLTVLRFPNDYVMNNINGVMERILETLG